MYFDSEAQDQLSLLINLGLVQQALQKYGNQVLPSLDTSIHLPVISRGDWVLLKTWKEGSPEDQQTPKWKGLIKFYLPAPLQSTYRAYSPGDICLELNLSPLSHSRNHRPTLLKNTPVKLQGIKLWNHLSRIKPFSPESLQESPTKPAQGAPVNFYRT